MSKGDRAGEQSGQLVDLFRKLVVGCAKKEKGSRIASISFGHIKFEMPIGHPNRDGKLV